MSVSVLEQEAKPRLLWLEASLEVGSQFAVECRDGRMMQTGGAGAAARRTVEELMTATQAEVRSWARSEGMTVNDRGSLSATVTGAYAAAHTSSKRGTTMTTARKVAVRKPAARRASARTASARKAAPKPAVRPTVTPLAVAPDIASDVNAPAPGTTDLAGGLRSYLASIETEVRAVSSLSERIDALVTDLNDLREQQAKRLIVLDQLRESVDDKSLGSFLDSAIKPRKTRVPEIVPDRLQ